MARPKVRNEVYKISNNYTISGKASSGLKTNLPGFFALMFSGCVALFCAFIAIQQ